MTRRTCVAVALVLAMVGGAWADAKPDDLDGTWLPESAEMAGKTFPDAVRKTMKLVMKGRDYTVTVGEQADKGTVAADAAAKPKSMDVVGKEGPNKGKTFKAIYELKGDTLKICYDLSGDGRPTAFATKEGTRLFLVVYKRAK